MADTKTLNLRVDADLKHQAETIFANLGIPTSTAINMFLRTVVRYGGIPFDLRISPNELETLRAVDDALKSTVIAISARLMILLKMSWRP